MSYNQKPPGTGNSGMGGTGPPNGPNNPQVAKSLAGFQQQMPNFQGGQPDLNALLQQQRLQNIFKHQQQHLFHLQHQMQQQQQHQQQHQQQQQQYKDRGSSEPLALTRTPAAAELLNKTYQQHHQQHPNGNPAAANSALNPLQQLQVNANLMQQIQAFQLMQQHQQQQQQQQHHAQTQQAPPPQSSNPLQGMSQQPLHGQKAQQQNAAVAAAALQLQQRYMSAAAAQVTNANKVGTTPPPLTATNQIKPPNLPPSTQITPVPSNSGGIGAASTSTNKQSSASLASGASASPSKQIAPSISLLPTKPPTVSPATPVAAHQQGKFNTNKGQTQATSATVTPTPAHNQKPTATTDAFSSAAPSGNALPITSESPVKPNTNADNSVSIAKAAHKSAAHTKAALPLSTTAGSAVDTVTKPITPLSSSNVAVAGSSEQLSSASPATLSAKSPEKRDDVGAQKSTEAVGSAKPSTIKPPVLDDKKAPTSGSGKVDPVAVASKTNTNIDRPISTPEKQPKVALQQPSESNASGSIKTAAVSTKLTEKPKDENKAISTAATKASHNNSSPEKKEQLAEKVDTSSKNEKIAEKASNKDANAKKEKQADEKTPPVALAVVDSAKSVEKPVALEKVSEKPEANVSAIQKPSEDSKLSSEVKKKVVESKNDAKEQGTSDQAKEKSEVEKDKEIETKVDQAKTTKTANSTVEPKEPTPKVVSASPTIQAEAQPSSETPASKKPQRQQKSNKSNANAASASSTASSTTNVAVAVEKPAAKIENVENDTEKATSSRVAREERRKKEKTVIEASALQTEATVAATTTTATASFTTTPKTPKPESNDTSNDRKSQRHRLKTILYQSPLPELAFITKLSASEASNSPKPMAGEDKLIVFYKNEYMAVRNAEGTFYLCQTMQNVYRTSPKISIRWLSEDPKDNSVYIPDFYDHTDIECVLTTVDLKRIDKGHLRLPNTEKVRIENILKKAIDVEKGLVPRPELTEENPDGLDLSLYKDESQIEKKTVGSLQTPVSTTRNARRSTKGNAANSTPKTASKATSNKRKSKNGAGGSSPAKKSKAATKKRKSLLKRTTKRRLSASDDDNESSDDNASDAEYRPSQKKSPSTSGATKSSPRVQRSPLAKARVVSPIASTSRNTNSAVAKASSSTPTHSRIERATKRKSSVFDLCTETESCEASKDTTTDLVNAKSEKSKNKDVLPESSTVPSKKSKTDAATTFAISNTASNADSESTSGSSSSSRPTRSRK